MSTLRSEVHLGTPIDAGNQEIRLLEIIPGNWSDPIECSLKVASLKENPEYATLSYVWGTASDRYPVKINSIDFEITKNLFTAMRRLRAHNHGNSMVIWIDAICIDQSCIPERNSQVQLMGKLYTQSKQVMVWLGEACYPESVTRQAVDPDHALKCDYDACYDLDSPPGPSHACWDAYWSGFESEPGHINRSLRAKEDLSPSHMALHVACFFCLLVKDARQQIRHLTSGPPFDPSTIDSQYAESFRAMIVFLLHNEWFNRLWVVQEVALAPAVRFFFGPVSLSLDLLIEAQAIFEDHLSFKCCTPKNEEEFGLCYLIRGFFDHVSSIKNVRQEVRQRWRRLPLFKLCLRYAVRSVTVDTDRVFALLGLCKDVNGDSTIQPDYNRSTEDVYTQVCRQFCAINGSLEFLSFAGIGNRLRVPSWVVDWTMYQNEIGFRHDFWAQVVDRYKASGTFTSPYQNFPGPSTIPQDRPEVDGDGLLLHGKELDRIVEVGDMPEPGENCNPVINQWRRMILTKFQPSADYPGHSSGEAYTYEDAFIQTLSAGCYVKSTSDEVTLLTAADRALFSKCSDYRLSNLDVAGNVIMPSEDTSIRRWEILRMVIIASWDRRLFLTSRGLLGLGSRHSAVGDFVVAVSQSPMPLILRSKQPAQVHEGDPTECVLVSDCYLDNDIDRSVFAPSSMLDEPRHFKIV